MQIGKDFPKIYLDLNGFIILEPNAIITDLIMASVSFYFVVKLYSRRKDHSFLKYWYYFFLTFESSKTFCKSDNRSLSEPEK